VAFRIGGVKNLVPRGIFALPFYNPKSLNVNKQIEVA